MLTCPREKQGKVCGGDCFPIESESGITWGWRCGKCCMFLERCQVCRNGYANVGMHLKARPDCAKSDLMRPRRTYDACNKKWASKI